MLKPHYMTHAAKSDLQPPLGGCVLKPPKKLSFKLYFAQPPLGGCVLKRACSIPARGSIPPAAFGRLCVETEDTEYIQITKAIQPPSGGCVSKPDWALPDGLAAVC